MEVDNEVYAAEKLVSLAIPSSRSVQPSQTVRSLTSRLYDPSPSRSSMDSKRNLHMTATAPMSQLGNSWWNTLRSPYRPA